MFQCQKLILIISFRGLNNLNNPPIHTDWGLLLLYTSLLRANFQSSPYNLWQLSGRILNFSWPEYWSGDSCSPRRQKFWSLDRLYHSRREQSCLFLFEGPITVSLNLSLFKQKLINHSIFILSTLDAFNILSSLSFSQVASSIGTFE